MLRRPAFVFSRSRLLAMAPKAIEQPSIIVFDLPEAVMVKDLACAFSVVAHCDEVR